MPLPEDRFAFTDALADTLRLPDETLGTSYLYLNKYHRFHRTSRLPDPLDPYTLSLATLSLAAKSTESPRRLSSILLPAHTLLHPTSPTSNHKTPTLAIPSPIYDVLRARLVQAELILLRVLGFELRIPSPLEYLQRYLERALEEVESSGEEFDAWDREAREEYGVVNGGLMESRLGRMCREKAINA
ncbi:MAG: hypothetical protein Q9222_001204 [Ikaeria aurantiellina]